jgi:hypothetical protein
MVFAVVSVGRDDLFDKLLASCVAGDVRNVARCSGVRALGHVARGDATAALEHFRAFTSPAGVSLDSASLGNSVEQRDVLDVVYAACLVVADSAAAAPAVAHRVDVRAACAA